MSIEFRKGYFYQPTYPETVFPDVLEYTYYEDGELVTGYFNYRDAIDSYVGGTMLEKELYYGDVSNTKPLSVTLCALKEVRDIYSSLSKKEEPVEEPVEEPTEDKKNIKESE